MKAFIASTLLFFMSLPAVATHGVERGLIRFPTDTIVPLEVQDFASSALKSRCVTNAVDFEVVEESVRVDIIDQGIEDSYYSLLVRFGNSTTRAADQVRIVVGDLAISNPRVDSIIVEQLFSLNGLCR